MGTPEQLEDATRALARARQLCDRLARMHEKRHRRRKDDRQAPRAPPESPRG